MSSFRQISRNLHQGVNRPALRSRAFVISVTGCTVTTGQGVGAALVALPVLKNRLPQDVPWNQIEAALNKLNRQQT